MAHSRYKILVFREEGQPRRSTDGGEESELGDEQLNAHHNTCKHPVCHDACWCRYRRARRAAPIEVSCLVRRNKVASIGPVSPIRVIVAAAECVREELALHSGSEDEENGKG